VEVFDTDRGRISIQICYDIEFPEVSRVAVEKGAQLIFVPFCTDERYGYLRVRYCAQARCVENQVYTAIAGSVGNLPHVPALGIHYAQSGVFTPSDIPFKRDAIAAEATPNIEMVLFEDLDLELLKRNRQSGTVLNWNDRRTDVFELKYTPPPEVTQTVQPPPRLSELVPVDAISLHAPARNRAEVVHALAHLLHADGDTAEHIERLLTERELLSTTAVGEGVALPHCRLDGASRICVAVLCLKEPIDFGASDHAPVQIFVGVSSPPTGSLHLSVLSRLATAFRRADVRAAVLGASEPGQLLRLLETIDEQPRRKT
jgi:mannitol/fructose-specific phosphotransferase system IIA component (Ntr-type)